MRKSTVMFMAVGIVVAAEHFVISGIVPDARAESLNVRPGAWEITTSTITTGLKISPELSTGLKPEQRAKMEQVLKSHDGKTMTMTSQFCLTKEDVSHDRIIKEMEDEDGDAEAQCKIKVISKSSSKLVLDRMCPGPHASTTHFTIDAKTAESFVATGDGELVGSGKARMEIRGKWLGASCEGIEE